jgi:hypothetical protein
MRFSWRSPSVRIHLLTDFVRSRKPSFIKEDSVFRRSSFMRSARWLALLADFVVSVGTVAEGATCQRRCILPADSEAASAGDASARSISWSPLCSTMTSVRSISFALPSMVSNPPSYPSNLRVSDSAGLAYRCRLQSSRTVGGEPGTADRTGFRTRDFFARRRCCG